MQQGTDLKAPVEVRIIGDDVTRLKTIAVQVEDIMKKAMGSRLVRSDFGEDHYSIRQTALRYD